MLARAVNNLFDFYYILIIIRIFLTWIPSIDTQTQPFRFICSIVDPFLNIFRGIIPPIGGMLDISPLIAIFVLYILQGLIVGLL